MDWSGEEKEVKMGDNETGRDQVMETLNKEEYGWYGQNGALDEAVEMEQQKQKQ